MRISDSQIAALPGHTIERGTRGTLPNLLEAEALPLIHLSHSTSPSDLIAPEARFASHGTGDGDTFVTCSCY
jgi:hypothetical protein